MNGSHESFWSTEHIDLNVISQFLATEPVQNYIVSVIASALTESIEIKKAERKRQESLNKTQQEQESLERRFDAALSIIKKHPDLLEQYMEICEAKDL